MVEVAVRSTQQAEDFRRCHALPSLVGQFMSKASEFCLLDSRDGLDACLAFWRTAALRLRCLARSAVSCFSACFGAPVHRHPRRSNGTVPERPLRVKVFTPPTPPAAPLPLSDRAC